MNSQYNKTVTEGQQGRRLTTLVVGNDVEGVWELHSIENSGNCSFHIIEEYRSVVDAYRQGDALHKRFQATDAARISLETTLARLAAK